MVRAGPNRSAATYLHRRPNDPAGPPERSDVRKGWGEDGYFRVLYAEGRTRQCCPHHSELMEVLGFAIDGGAHIEENHGSLFVGNESGDSGTQNSFHSAGNEHADGEGGTCVTHGDHSIRLASRGQLEGYAQRRIFLAT